MHAVVFTVDIKPDWQGDPQAELDIVVALSQATPGFVRGTWATGDDHAMSILLYDSEQAAQTARDNAFVPPDASVTLRGVEVLEVARDV